MKSIRIDWEHSPAPLNRGLREIVASRGAEFTPAKDAISLRFINEFPSGRPGFALEHQKAAATIRYARPCDAFRGLGCLLGQIQAGRLKNITQTCQFDLLAIKLDCSRNGVPHLRTLQELFRQAALLGFNGYVLYMEDTFEIPGEPFFGYLRGPYTQADLKAIDDYGHDLGLEVFPHVQTLGHVEQILQWPAYADLRDLPAVFLADHEPTYVLIEKMLRAVSAPFRSRRIFPGMDEAHGLGTGRYRRLKGLKASFDIFNDHMRRVCDICNRLGLKPTTSGDMYFRLGSKDNWYYDEEAVIPPEIIKSIPAEVQLAYWDYYHTDAPFYERWIDHHRAMGKEPMMLGGIWTWSHFWAQLPFSLAATDAMMEACRNKGLRETVCCLWGDDGMQIDPFSALPGLAHYAEHAYAGGVKKDAVRRQCQGATGEDCYDAYLRASDIDLLTTPAHMREIPDSPSTWLLWEDPLLGLMQPQIRNRKLASHHAKLAKELDRATGKSHMAKRLAFPAQIARVLSLKVDLHGKLAAAMRKRDKAALRKLLRTQVEPLRREVDRLWRIHRALWLETYRPFGLEGLEIRYGGLRTRLQTLADRLRDYLAGRIDHIPELETRLQKIFPEEDIYSMIHHARAITPSAHF